MCKFRPISILAGLISFVVGISFVYLYNERGPHKRSIYTPPDFNTLPVSGFSEVTSARNGELVTISGTIDDKGVCLTYQMGSNNICETYFGDNTNSIPVRIKLCNEITKSNCIPPFKIPLDYRELFLYDYKGDVVDFDGAKLIEPPNTWTHRAQPLKLTGKVSVINGVGRLIEPIERIEATPPN